MKNKVLDLLTIVLGIFLFSFALNVFFAPHQIVPGGISGLSIVIESIFHIRRSIVLSILNIPIFLIGLVFLGKKFVLNSLLGVFLVPIFVELTSTIPSFTDDVLLAALFGGVTTGVGVGMLLSKQASLAGTDILAKVVSKYTQKPVGKILIVIDSSITLAALYAFGIEKTLYSIATVYLIGRVVDIYIKGFSDSKSVLVISDKIEEINTLFLTELNGRTTKLEARGGYTNSSQVILMCVIPSKDLVKLKRLIGKIDTNALVLVQDSYEVYGKNFSIA